MAPRILHAAAHICHRTGGYPFALWTMLGIIDALLGRMGVISRYHDVSMRLAVFVKCRAFAFHLLNTQGHTHRSTHRSTQGHTHSPTHRTLNVHSQLHSLYGHTQDNSTSNHRTLTQDAPYIYYGHTHRTLTQDTHIYIQQN